MFPDNFERDFDESAPSQPYQEKTSPSPSHHLFDIMVFAQVANTTHSRFLAGEKLKPPQSDKTKR
jgi:hypothetical protein